MLMKIWICYILGYVNIRVEGFYIERFINKCISKKILLWKMKRNKSTILNVNIRMKDFREVTKIAKSTQCRVKIANKKGLPFILHKYRKFKILVYIFLVMIISITISSRFIWNIEINGTSLINKADIVEILSTQGIKTGVLKRKIDCQKVINQIRLERSDIAWVGMKIKGTNVIIEIIEATIKPIIINPEDYCDIVAIKDGIIVKANAQNGTLQVKEGDLVEKGDVLIGGWIEGKYTGIRYLHSEGSVMAKVWYSQKERKYYKSTETVQTGDTEKKYSIIINNFEVNLYKTLSKFEKYDTIYKNNKLKIFSDFYLPIGVKISENYELQDEVKEYSKEQAIDIVVQTAVEKLEKQTMDKNNIINKYTNINETEEFIEVEVIYEVLEEIGAKEKNMF